MAMKKNAHHTHMKKAEMHSEKAMKHAEKAHHHTEKAMKLAYRSDMPLKYYTKGFKPGRKAGAK